LAEFLFAKCGKCRGVKGLETRQVGGMGVPPMNHGQDARATIAQNAETRRKSVAWASCP